MRHLLHEGILRLRSAHWMAHHVPMGTNQTGVTGLQLSYVKSQDLQLSISTSFSTDAFDNDLIMQTLQQILQGETVQIPVYDFVTHSR